MPTLAPRTKVRYLTLLSLALLVLFTLLRLGFLLRFEGLGGLREAGAASAFYLGLKFDARLTALLVLPAWLLLKAGVKGGWSRNPLAGPVTLAAALGLYVVVVTVAMVDDVAARPWLLAFLAMAAAHRGLARDYGIRSHRSANRIWAGFALAALAAVFLAYAIDFATYGYIHTRLNGTLLMFLENPLISARMAWESYPVLRIALAFCALLALCGWAMAALLGPWRPSRRGPGWRWGLNLGVSLLLLVGMYGKWSRYPLRWAEAFESRSTFQAHMALNPVLFFLETRTEMDGGFDLKQVRELQPVLAEYFGIPVRQDAQGNPTLLREGLPRPLVKGRPNVVFIQLESFAGFKTGILGNPLDPTPFFDGLARDGIFFDRFYVAMENTSRSMFATLFGIPDVSSVQNATRNPLLLDQASVLQALDGYHKTFFLGGSANWAQIRGVLKNNFKDLAIHEEGSFRSPVVDVWGICDADLLMETREHLTRETTPFWSYIQTSGNHPPFTIPGHLKGFAKVALPQERLTRAGFTGNDEFNAVRLMDYSLRQFFEAARREPWFANTVFLLWGDHGLPRGSTDKRFGDLTLAIHNVPFVIYAPGLLPKGRREHGIATQMDILPTLASLLGRPYRTATLGRDLLDPAFRDKAAAFTFTTFRRPPRFGLLQGDYYLNVNPDGGAALFRTDQPDPADLAAAEPERKAQMLRLGRAFHEWSKYLLTHNKPEPEGK
jgi:phosphoglycerol transferase MdoB-like AlkP superfamily enzyme